MDNSNVDSSTIAGTVSNVINSLGLQSISNDSNDGKRNETSGSSRVQNSCTLGTVESSDLVNRTPRFSKSCKLRFIYHRNRFINIPMEPSI